MRILALETSGFYGSVAVLEDSRVLGEMELQPGQRSAQALAPTIQQQLAAVQWRPSDVELIVVTQGPGSFTGLRVGVTTAKTLAYATGAGVLGVNTLDVVAAQAPRSEVPVYAVLDAQRQQLFVGLYDRKADEPGTIIHETKIVDRTAWLQSLDEHVAATGPGLQKISNLLPATTPIVEEKYWTPRAATVGQVGLQAHLSGRRHDLWTLLPLYYRPSAAEEKASNG